MGLKRKNFPRKHLRSMRRKGERKPIQKTVYENKFFPVPRDKKIIHKDTKDIQGHLKYLRLARAWVRNKYKLSLTDLEWLLFLDTVGIFKIKDFYEFKQALSWDRKRWDRFVEDGLVYQWRERQGNHAAVWKLTTKARRLVTRFYKMAAGETKLPIIKHPKKYSEKVYNNASKWVNKREKNIL